VNRHLAWISVLVVAVVLVLVGVGLVGTAVATDEAPECGEVGYETNSSGFYEVTNVSQLQCIGDDEEPEGEESDSGVGLSLIAFVVVVLGVLVAAVLWYRRNKE